MPSVLPVKGQKAPLCVVWQCASFVQQASGRPDDESPGTERTAWLRNTRSGMITRRGTDLISSMPDFLQMEWVDTKKQLKLTTTSGLMTNKKGGGNTGATEERWCVTCLMVCSAEPRLHYKLLLNSPSGWEKKAMDNSGFVILGVLKCCHMVLPHFLMSWVT